MAADNQADCAERGALLRGHVFVHIRVSTRTIRCFDENHMNSYGFWTLWAESLWIHMFFEHHDQTPCEFIWFLNIMIKTPVNSYGFWASWSKPLLGGSLHLLPTYNVLHNYTHNLLITCVTLLITYVTSFIIFRTPFTTDLYKWGISTL